MAGEQGCETEFKHSCDQNSNIEASLFIPKRSKTLPNELSYNRRYKSLPSRTSSLRSYSLGHHDRDKVQASRDDQRLMARRVNSPIGQNEDVVSNRLQAKKAGNKESRKTIPVICLSDMDSGTFEGSSSDNADGKPDFCDNFCAMDDEGDGITFSVKDDDKSDSSETKTLTNQSLKKSPNLRDGRCSSSDSSRTSNKSRADSFNTDSTTSGVSSCESGPHTCLSSDFMSLSPIASTSSIDTLEIIQRGSSDMRDLIHPSSFRRKSLNLKRVPSLGNKQASPAYGILPSAQLLDGMSTETAIMYTTSRDALGYATWRSIKRQRRISSDVESDMGLNSLYGEEEGSELTRKNSLDSKMSVETFSFRSRYIFYMIFLLTCTRYKPMHGKKNCN